MYSSVTDLAFYHVYLWSCSLIPLAFTLKKKKVISLAFFTVATFYNYNSICHKN